MTTGLISTIAQSQLETAATGRTEFLFTADMANSHRKLSEAIQDARILVIGAAGAIGSTCVTQMADFGPGCLHMVDVREEQLQVLTQALASSPVRLPPDVQALPLEPGSVEFDHFLSEQPPYDYVLNFPASVPNRPGIDPYTLMRMFMTQAGTVRDLLEKLTIRPVVNTFCCSSEVVCAPHTIAGALKILTERVHMLYADHVPFTAARLGDVTLCGIDPQTRFLDNLRLRQPLTASSADRYRFITAREAAHLCLLSCFLGENRDAFYCRVDAEINTVSAVDVACGVLSACGMEPEVFTSRQEASAAALCMSAMPDKWPCWFNAAPCFDRVFCEDPPVTDGEIDTSGFKDAGVIRLWSLEDSKPVLDCLTAFDRIYHSRIWRREEMIAALRSAVPRIASESC